MTPDLDKLRRFALVIGLVLITYSVALVELGGTIHPLGLPLKVSRPEWLGVCLAIASIWGMGRFFYYGVLKTESPTRKRNPLLRKLLQGGKPAFQPDDVDRYVDNIRQLFPRIPGLRITADTTPEHLEKEGDEAYGYKKRLVVERINVPWPFYVAAWIEDADYFSPIWLNVIALAAWVWRIAL